MNRAIPGFVAAGLFAAFLPASASEQAAIEFRESVMTIYKWYLKPMSAMAKGEVAFDANTFRVNAQGLAVATQLDIAPGFPEGSDFDTEAKPEIWEHWPEFKEKFEALQTEAGKLGEAANSGDEAVMKAQFGKTAKTCGGCHKKFREK